MAHYSLQIEPLNVKKPEFLLWMLLFHFEWVVLLNKQTGSTVYTLTLNDEKHRTFSLRMKDFMNIFTKLFPLVKKSTISNENISRIVKWKTHGERTYSFCIKPDRLPWTERLKCSNSIRRTFSSKNEYNVAHAKICTEKMGTEKKEEQK